MNQGQMIQGQITQSQMMSGPPTSNATSMGGFPMQNPAAPPLTEFMQNFQEMNWPCPPQTSPVATPVVTQKPPLQSQVL
jgi:hypothetical protein